MEAESLYKMKPDPNEVFVPSQVEEIIKSVLEQHLTEVHPYFPAMLPVQL